MHFELLWWAISIGVAWLVLTAFIPIDEWFKTLFGRKGTIEKLEERVAALEKRLDNLQKKPDAAPGSDRPNA